MSTTLDFNQKECDKIDALCVNAYLDLSLDDNNITHLLYGSPWGSGDIDLSPAVKAAETVTSLYLSPANNPECLVYEKEDGESDCITGDALSRILSMTLLKDVSQTNPIFGGAVYMYNSTTNLFQPYDLQTFVDTTNLAINNLGSRLTAVEGSVSALQSRMAAAEANITNLQGRVATNEADIASLKNRVSAAETAISNLQTTVANHETRLAAIEAKLTPPSDAPSNVKVVFGNINEYSDPNAVINSSGTATTLDKTHGLYTHTLSTTVYGDEIFG